MIRSMTGFTSFSEKVDNKEISWEIRTVNHRYLDVSLSLPEGFQAQENEFKALVGQFLKRGKVDAKCRYQLSENNAESSNDILIDDSQVVALGKAQQALEAIFKRELPLSTMDVLHWQGVVKQPSLALDTLLPLAKSSLDKALNDLLKSREREGSQLAGFITQQADQIEKIVSVVRSRRKEVVAALRDKVIKRIADLDIEPASIDNNRLEQELVFQAQRLDVDEELDRLDAHLVEVRAILKRDEPVGRRLDFLIQELNREANTLGSKSNDAETTRAAVDLKVLIEKMREQVMNIE